MQILAHRKQQQNQAAIDPWTPVHMAAGLAMGLVESLMGTYRNFTGREIQIHG